MATGIHQTKGQRKAPRVPRERTDLLIALVGPIGARLPEVAKLLQSALAKDFGYTVETIRVSELLLETAGRGDVLSQPAYKRIDTCMTLGDELRRQHPHEDKLDFCAMLAVAAVAAKRKAGEARPKPHAFIVNSLKNPDEVALMRQIYGNGFFLIGVHCDMDHRQQNLVKLDGMTSKQATELIGRDRGEKERYGQQTEKTFHLSDFFIRDIPDNTATIIDIERILDIIFGDPFATPTFDEFAMFMAFASAVRSADLSRQVGAVVANQYREIVASGANDCPAFGGGLYWLERDPKSFRYFDVPQGRDYMRSCDPNKDTQGKIIEEIAAQIERAANTNKTWKAAIAALGVRDLLRESPISDLTEYGRVVHAEMEALLNCARNGTATRGSTLYCTTFPCHNCAKHIVAAGVKRVVYIEPYPKSKAEQFHSDSISFGEKIKGRATFEAFVGIGPRRFFDLFAMEYGIGLPKPRRKEGSPQRKAWGAAERKAAVPRVPLSKSAYLQMEQAAAFYVVQKRKTISRKNGKQP